MKCQGVCLLDCPSITARLSHLFSSIISALLSVERFSCLRVSAPMPKDNTHLSRKQTDRFLLQIIAALICFGISYAIAN